MSKPLSEMTHDEILDAIKEIRERRLKVADKPFVVKGPAPNKGNVITGQLGETLDALFESEDE